MKNACLTSEQIETRLREADVNPTAQRIALCRYVLCEADHPTVEDIKTWADENFPKVSLATVYNTMHVLEEAGLVRSFQLPHKDKVIYDKTLKDHYHFCDEETGEIIDVPETAVHLDTTAIPGYQIQATSAVFYGRKK